MGYLHWGLLALLVSAGVGYFFLGSHQPPEVPDIKLEYWGSGQVKPDDPAIRPFKIHFPQKDITELKTKLKLTKKLVPPLDGIGFEYGTNSNFMQEFIDYWINKYNWTEREKFLNKFPHFKTQIGGLDIHFLHVKPDPKKLNKDVRVVPLMLVHGWPGCIREFYELIPLLTEPRDGLVFEVVAPSLPGYAFSESAKRTGMGPPQMAVILAEIMTRLGHQQFYLQGGDWGSVIGQALSTLRPNRVLGFHCNFCLATNPAARNRVLLSWLFPSFFVEEDRIEVYKKQFFDSFVKESGYYHIQATKPDTIGIALTDSPAGLAAYLLEKFSTGTNKDFRSLKNGGLDKYNKDDLLDFLMIYWLTNSITTSIRIYSENYLKETYSWEVASIPVNVPTHCARFPNEMLYYPKVVLKEQYTNLVSITDLPRGGHFAAFEEPKLLADDVWNFVKKNIHL